MNAKQTKVNEVVEEIKFSDDLKTTSSKIRWLNSQGKSRSEISKILNIRYQHVRNVLIQPLKDSK